MLNVLRKILCFFLTAVMALLSTIGVTDPRLESMKSVQKLADHVYTMDYTYDYDIDDFLDNGVDNMIDLLLKAVNKTVFNDLNGFACTTFNSVTPTGEYLFSRNYDYMDSGYMIVWTHPENGYASVSSTSLMFMAYDNDFEPDSLTDSVLTLIAPYVPLDGINEKGLSIGVLEIEKDATFQITDKTDLTTTTMIRAVLDKAATVEEAVEIFRNYDMRDSIIMECTYHYQIADAMGNSAIIEYIDGEMNVIYPEKRTNPLFKYQVATNFVITPGVDDPLGMGQDRYETAFNALDASLGITTVKGAMDILKSTSMKDLDLHGYICSTLWSVVYNTKDLTMNVCTMNNYDTMYTFSVNEPQVLLTK